MARAAFLLWQLRTYRALLARTADQVSLSFFLWSRAPGNVYATFYPTAWLPAHADRAARGDRALGHSIFARVATPSDAPRRYTVAHYGDDALALPAWSRADDGDTLVVCRRRRHGDPEVAAARLHAALDVEGLARLGRRDPDTSAVVDAWLARVVDCVESGRIGAVAMDFEQTGMPSALWTMALYDREAGTRDDVWWGGRDPSREG